MFKHILVVCLWCALTAAISLPSEPKLPSSVCEELKAELSESGGVLAAADESKPDTKRLQEALTKCTSKGAVKLSKGTGNAFLSGPLTLPTGVILWVDAGVTLFASRNSKDFELSSGSCGVIGNGGGCHPFITGSNLKNSGIVGEGTIDGRGGAHINGGSKSWWDLANEAHDGNKAYSDFRLIQVSGSDFTMYKIRLHNSPNFHVAITMNGLVVWGVKLQAPTKTYAGQHARNADAFDPSGSNLVFTQCYVDAGDDNIALKGGSPVTNVLIQDNHFYRGHGMSIGSETNAGVTNVTVKNLSIDGADSGLRIKSDSTKGGNVQGILYENICIRNVDAPLNFDTYYSNSTGTKYPNFHDIHVKDVHILSSTKKQVVFRGYNSEYPLKITLDNVISDVELTAVTASDCEITEGPGAVTGIPVKTTSGKNVKIIGEGGKSTAVDCSKMFVPFPE